MAEESGYHSEQLLELHAPTNAPEKQSVVTQTAESSHQASKHENNVARPPLTTRANMEPSATVKFTLLPMKQVVTFALSIKMPIRDVKEQFSTELKANPKFIKFYSENDGEQTYD